jgi:thiol-disulfide isomerase/thioredoxin
VLAQTAPEARGNGHRAGSWRRQLGVAASSLGGKLVVAAALKLLVAVALVVAASTASTVRAADTALREWTDDAPLPPFSLDALAGNRIDGNRIDLAQLRGNVVLVHFFATWCEPCRAELTSLQQLAGRMRSRRVVVVTVDAGETDRTVQRFFATLSLPFPVLLDRDRSATTAWRVQTLPTTFLLDSDLMPRFVVEGDFDWNGPEAETALMKLIVSPAAAAKAGSAFTPIGFDKE